VAGEHGDGQVQLGDEVVDASFDGMSVNNVMVDEDDVPWVGGDNLWRWDPIGEEFVSVDLPYRGVESGYGYGAASDGQGTVWAGSRDDSARGRTHATDIIRVAAASCRPFSGTVRR